MVVFGGGAGVRRGQRSRIRVSPSAERRYKPSNRAAAVVELTGDIAAPVFDSASSSARYLTGRPARYGSWGAANELGLVPVSED